MIRPITNTTEGINEVTGTVDVANGSSGNQTQVPGSPATVGMLAATAGGMESGSLVEADVDSDLFHFNNEDAPLMNLMLCARKVKVNSPEVDHYMIDEPCDSILTAGQVRGGKHTATLPLDAGDAMLPKVNTTLLVEGVDGYDETGKVTPGRNLMLFVTARDTNTGMPIVKAVNGPRATGGDYAVLPDIPEGKTVHILANSLYETQKEVDPDLIIPAPQRIYLQKRGMNQVVSDYFDSQRKRIPFSKAVIAEQAITNFKVRGNRTLWAGRGGKFKVAVDKMGMQTVYTTEGVRWQIKREMQAPTDWSVNQVIALAKMFFTGEDVPRSAILLAGKDLLEAIQKVDYSNHPEIQLTTKVNSIGWTVTNFHTVFGDIEIKREPTLDRLGWSKSGALLGENRLVHYVYSAEHTFSDRVEGEEATRSGVLIWDALALKGNCHIWIDGESHSAPNPKQLVLWEKTTAPEAAQTADGTRFYLVKDCPGIDAAAKSGQIWEAAVAGEEITWTRATGQLYF